MNSLQPYLQIILICAICIFTIISYGTFRCKHTDFTDPLTSSFFPHPINKFLDGWGITHFLFFAFLAYNFPQRNTMLFIWLLGVMWEVVESFAKDHPFYISKCHYRVSDKNEEWWYGRWQDIVMNSLGMLCGYYLSKVY